MVVLARHAHARLPPVSLAPISGEFTILGIFDEMSGNKRYMACLDAVNFGFGDILRLFGAHVAGIVRGIGVLYGGVGTTAPKEDL